jgi:tetratricopeptide (TPR) repeat protein
VTTSPPTCRTCGLRLDPTTGLCLYCSVPSEGPQPAAAEAAAVPDAAARAAQAKAEDEDDARERELGLLLFEAEEALARGAAEKAVVLASKAIKDRPDSLTARSLQERARRELLRGRRRDRLEARVREAETLLAGGDAAGAERIVTSALKLIPSHPVALALFKQLKERRQQAPTAEAWAEQELERLTKARARRALETAQVDIAAGREWAALLAIRRGLRRAPDDSELLKMLRDVEHAMERGKAGQHAVQAQVRAGLDLLDQGRVDESLKVLRAVLRADPDNVRAQVAIQQVRKTWLRRQAVAAVALPMETPAAPPPAPAPPPPAVAPAPAASSPAVSSRPAQPPPPSHPAIPVAAPSAARPPAAASRPAPASVSPPVPAHGPAVSWDDVEAAARGRAAEARRTAGPGKAVVPALPPRPQRSALPMGAILAGAAVLIAVVMLVVTRRPRQAPAPTVATAPAARPATPAARPNGAPTTQLPGPLDAADPDLRQAIEAVLSAYARALETADAAALATARPDLTAEEGARLIAAFTGALNAATDLRVLDVKARGDLAVVTVLRTDVIVGGAGGPRDPTEETLRFWRRRGEWVLVR